MTERPETWRTFATLQELEREESGASFPTKRVATVGALDVGVAERELDLLDAVDAVDQSETDDGEVEHERTDVAVADVARRLATMDELSNDESDALQRALSRGDVDPGTLSDVNDARQAADRELGSEESAERPP